MLSMEPLIQFPVLILSTIITIGTTTESASSRNSITVTIVTVAVVTMVSAIIIAIIVVALTVGIHKYKSKTSCMQVYNMILCCVITYNVMFSCRKCRKYQNSTVKGHKI